MGTPQSRSRVMARGLRSSTRLAENLSTLGRQSVRVDSHCPSDSANAGRSRKKCSVSTNCGVSPLILERGLMRSAGARWLPQVSHWAARPAPEPRMGQAPATQRYGDGGPVDGQIGPLTHVVTTQHVLRVSG